MYRPLLPPPGHFPQRRQETWGLLIAPFTILIFVSVSLRYGYFRDSRMVLGPSSSRLMKARSVLFEQVEVRDGEKKGVLVYGFPEKPELSFETNWSVSSYMIVASYNRKVISLWLNKGSKILMRWEARTSTLNQLQVVLIKGEQKYETLLPKMTSSLHAFNLSEPLSGKEAQYTIEEDNNYYLGLINTNPKSIIMKLSVNVTSKMYELSKARNMCSTIQGSCRLKLLFHKTQYVVVTTPDNGDINGWFIEVAFVARVITYMAILGFIIVVAFLILKYLGACDTESSDLVDTAVRIMDEDNKMCPICRRLIHKVRRLFSP